VPRRDLRLQRTKIYFVRISSPIALYIDRYPSDGVNMVQEKDPYDFDHARGWRRWRALRPGYGMYHDVKRRLPYYWSDIRDGFNYRTVAGTIRIYFVKLVSL